MTRRARIAKLEAQERGHVGPDAFLAFAEPDLSAGVWRDTLGREKPLTLEDRARAEDAQRTGVGLLRLGPLPVQARARR